MNRNELEHYKQIIYLFSTGKQEENVVKHKIPVIRKKNNSN